MQGISRNLVVTCKGLVNLNTKIKALVVKRIKQEKNFPRSKVSVKSVSKIILEKRQISLIVKLTKLLSVAKIDLKTY